MSSKQLGEMYEGDSADTYGGKISPHVHGGLSGGSCVRRPGSEDPHQHEWILSTTHVCRITFKHLPQLLRTHIQSFRKFQKFQKKKI